MMLNFNGKAYPFGFLVGENSISISNLRKEKLFSKRKKVINSEEFKLKPFPQKKLKRKRIKPVRVMISSHEFPTEFMLFAN